LAERHHARPLPPEGGRGSLAPGGRLPAPRRQRRLPEGPRPLALRERLRHRLRPQQERPPRLTCPRGAASSAPTPGISCLLRPPRRPPALSPPPACALPAATPPGFAPPNGLRLEPDPWRVVSYRPVGNNAHACATVITRAMRGNRRSMQKSCAPGRCDWQASRSTIR